jgi:hypothetical protein
MTSRPFRNGTLLGIALFAAAAGAGMEAHAQTRPQDEHRWLRCDVDWLFSIHNTGPNFTVNVSFHNNPVSSVRILLARKDTQPDERAWAIVATSETDSRGIGRFFAIPPGKYEAWVEEELLTPASEEIDVTANNEDPDEINFEWPGSSLTARNLRGRLTLSNKSNKEPAPLQNVLVQVLDLRTAKLLASTHTNSEGYYELPSQDPGLYAVRINEDQDDLSSHTDDMAVEIKTNAIEENIPVIKLAVTDCGTELSRPPDEALFERAMSAVEQNRFPVASLSLQTLVNTYPNSEYASKAKSVLEDPRIAKCGESFSSAQNDCDGKSAATPPID